MRHYARPSQARERAQAILVLGLAARAALMECGDAFEPVLYAICDALALARDLRFAVRNQ